jgi:hypothetical protein
MGHHNHRPHHYGPRVVERPVYVQPMPVSQAPMYRQQLVDPSLNFNFTIPLR